MLFRSGELEALCKILGEINTGSEIGHFLRQLKIEDLNEKNTKWKRLYNALAKRQNDTGTGNIVLSYITLALQPARYVSNSSYYHEKLRVINTVLAFHGLEFCDDGKFHVIREAKTLTEAEQRASKLKKSIIYRKLHPDLLNYCRSELLQDNYFHAVLEACKSIAANIRKTTGLKTDGAKLIDEVFSGEAPILIINAFQTDTEKGEQKGFLNMAKGLFGTFRNPTAHEPKIEWKLNEEDALDLFTMASYILRRIDNAKKNNS